MDAEEKESARAVEHSDPNTNTVGQNFSTESSTDASATGHGQVVNTTGSPTKETTPEKSERAEKSRWYPHGNIIPKPDEGLSCAEDVTVGSFTVIGHPLQENTPTESEFESEELPQRPQPSPPVTNQFRQVVFHVIVDENAKDVFIGGEIWKQFENAGSRNLVQKLHKCEEGYWKSDPVPVVVGEQFSYRYGVVLDSWSFLGGEKTEWDSQSNFSRNVVHHYDIFGGSGANMFKNDDKKQRGCLKFFEIFFKALGEGQYGIREALSNCNEFDVRSQFLDRDRGGVFVRWAIKQTGKAKNEDQKLLLAILLGQIASVQRSVSILQGEKGQADAANSLLHAISTFDSKKLPRDSSKYLLAVATPLVNVSSYQGRLSAVVFFCNVLHKDDLLKLQANLSPVQYNEYDFRLLVKKSSQVLKTVNEVLKKEILVNAFLTHAPTLNCLTDLVEEFSAELKSPQELNGPFMIEFLSKCESMEESNVGYNATILKVWERVPTTMRCNLSDGFAKVVVRMVKDNDCWNEDDIEHLNHLLRDKSLRTSAHMFAILEATSTKQDLHKLVLETLNSEAFYSIWNSLLPEQRKKLCMNCFDCVLVFQRRYSSEVVSTLAAFEEVCETYLVRNDEAIQHSLGNRALSRFPVAENRMTFLLDALSDIYTQTRSWFAQDWYVTQISHAFAKSRQDAHSKLQQVVDAIKRVIPDKSDGGAHIHLYLNKMTEALLSIVLDNINLPACSETNNDKAHEEVFRAVIGYGHVWIDILQANGSVKHLQRHPKYQSVEQASKWFQSAVTSQKIRVGFVEMLKAKSEIDYLANFCSVPTGSEQASVFQTQISLLFKELEYFSQEFKKLETVLRICSETTRDILRLEDIESIYQQMNRLKATRDSVYLQDIISEKYWEPFNFIRARSQAIYNLHSSVLFKSVAKSCLREAFGSSTTPHQTTFAIFPKKSVTDVAEILGIKAVSMFIDACKPLFDKDTEISLSVAEELWWEFQNNEEIFEQEINFIEIFSSRGPVMKDQRNNLQTFFRLPDLNIKISKTLEAVEAAGMVPDEKSEIIQNLISFQQLVSDKSSSLSMVTLAIEGEVKHLEELLDSDEVIDVISELGKARELLEFSRKTANEEMTFLIDAVEDHSEQLVNVTEAVVSDLIDVHRFLRSIFKDGSTDPFKFLKNAKAGLQNSKCMAAKIKVCRENIHSLKNLYSNVANRGEVTKRIIANVLKSGIYGLAIELNGEWNVTLSYISDEGKVLKQTEAELQDLRSRALLISGSDKSVTTANQRNKGNEMEKVAVDCGQLIEQVDLVFEIVNTCLELQSSGNPNYKKFWAKSLSAVEHESIVEMFEKVKEDSKTWKVTLAAARDEHFFLNYFRSDQLWTLYDFFSREGSDEDRESLNKDAYSLLRFIDPSVTLHELDNFLDLYEAPLTNLSLEAQLSSIGTVLDQGFKTRQKRYGRVGDDTLPAKTISRDVKQMKVHVALLDINSNQTVHAVMSLFKECDGRIPEPSRLIFCHEDTTWDEVSLFLRRCSNRNTKESNLLHCLANVEKLENEVQFKLVSVIKSYQKEGSMPGTLALVCRGGKHNYFASQFPDNVIENIARMSDLELKKWINAPQESNLDTHFVTSDLAGLGKTEFVHKEAARKKCRIVTFPISGHVSRGNLLERLSSLAIHQEFECLHFDIGEVDDPLLLDTFLFEFIVLGMVSFQTRLCHRQPTKFFIEIANTQHQWLRDSFPVCKCFRKADDHLLSKSVFDKLIVSSEITSPIQVVCHYLDTVESGCLSEADLIFSGNARLEPLSRQRCVDLLKIHLKDKHQLPAEILSFSTLNTFLNVLAVQLLKVSSSPYFRTENVKQMLEAPGDLRNQLFKSLFDLSLDFAVRQVDTCSSKSRRDLVSDASIKDTQRIGEKSEDVLARFRGMKLWKENNHLVLMFHSQGHSVSILYRKVEEVPDTIKELVTCQQVAGERGTLQDYNTMSQNELQATLIKVAGSPSSTKTTEEDKPYVLTADNILKMALILTRIRARVPVIIMGETGCGKTALVRYLAHASGTTFYDYNLHAGITEGQLINFIEALKAEAESCKGKGNPIWVFFDEINVCDHLGIINEVLCHHELRGKPLPSNLIFLAACNPYQLRPEHQHKTAGLSKEEFVDDLSKLVYRVHPLPETMLDYVWDYGSLSPEDERSYIERMVEGLFEDRYTRLLADLLFHSQEFIRRTEKTPFCVSLRDINRCKRLMKWFNETLKKRPPLQQNKIEQHLNSDFKAVTATDIKLRSIVLALAHCYQSRLPSANLREEYRKEMSQLFLLENHPLSETYIKQIVRVEEEEYLARMELPPGTAKNEALRDNVFIILVSLLNYLPVFVVGKPGCSKSLSVQIIRSNLRGRDSTDEFFKQLPQLLIVSHQGSESSTSEGIQKVFEKAQKYKTNNKDESVLPVVLLDEVGLAEQSPFNPLKVLHSLLEPSDGRLPDIGVVGISNWALDPAKMNRAIHLSRPEPDINDLYETGRSIRHASKTTGFRSDHPGCHLFPSDENLECLATAYHKFQRNQKHANYFGLRDYYSLVKCLSFPREVSDQELDKTGEKRFQRAFQRNFGGLPDNANSIQSVFSEQMAKCSIYEAPADVPVTDMIKENLCDENARHLMIITSGDAATDILTTTLQSLNKEVITIIGSQLEEDQCEAYNYRVLSRIILYMERDCVLILRDLDSIYGSLYDMLNQNYTVVGGKKNCRVALGPYSNPMCQVHNKFRCLVLIEESKVPYTDPPFLNRFEKQMLRFADVLDEQEKSVVNEMKLWTHSVSTGPNLDKQFDEKDMFVGFQADTLPSLVLSNSKHPGLPHERLVKKCKEDLMSTASVDGVLRSCKSELADTNPEDVRTYFEEYFKKPVHFGLSHFLHMAFEDPHHQTNSEDDPMLLVLTNSSIHTDISKLLQLDRLYQQQQESESTSHPSLSCQLERLSAFKSEKNMTRQIQTFWMESDARLLILQCRFDIDGPNMMLAKSIVEYQRQQYQKSVKRKVSKKVCIVVHDFEAQGRAYLPFNFLSSWQTVMIDSLDPPAVPLPSLVELGVTELFESDKRLTRTVVRNELQWCLMNCIKYKATQRKPHEILKLTETVNEIPEVMEAILRLVLKWIRSHDESNENTNPNDVRLSATWLLQIASDPQALNNATTLDVAINQFLEGVVRIPLAKLVYFLEQESAWNVLMACEEDDQKLEVWTSLLQEGKLVKLDDVPESRGVESYSLYQPIFPLKFPFSSVFAKQIDSLRGMFMENLSRMRALAADEEVDQVEVISDYTNEIDGRLLNRLFYRLSPEVEKKVPQFSNERWLRDNIFLYVEDLCDLKSAEFRRWLTRDQRAKLLKASCSEIMKFCDSTTDIHLFLLRLHACFWFQTNFFSDVMQLVSACSDVLADQNEVGDLLEEHGILLQELFSSKKEDNVLLFEITENINPTEDNEFQIHEEDKTIGSAPCSVNVNLLQSENAQVIETMKDEEQKAHPIPEKEEEFQNTSLTDLNTPVGMKQNKSSNERSFADLISEDQPEQDAEGSSSSEESVRSPDSLPEFYQPAFEEALVAQICKSLLSAKHINQITVNEWYRRVSLVLTSAVNIFVNRVPPMVFHVLRVCSDFTRLVVLNDLANVQDLCALAETGMSEEGSFFERQNQFHIVCQRIDSLADSVEQERKHHLHEFLFHFYDRCIDACAMLELRQFAEVFDAIAERTLRQENPSIAYTVPVLVKIIHNEIPHELLEEVICFSNKVKENPFLACIDKYLSQKEDEARPDSLTAVVCSDVIESLVFKKVSLLEENGSPHISLQNLQASINVLTQDDVSNKGIRLVCAVAYLRSFMKSTAEVIRQDTVVSEEVLLALIELDTFFSQTSDCELFMARKSAILLSLLRHIRMDSSMYEVKTLCQANRIIPGLRNNVQWVEEKSSKVYFYPFIKLKENTEIFTAVANSVRYGINQDRLTNVLAEASEGRLQRLQTFAALEEFLFRVKAERTMKDTEINIGQFLARGLQEFQSPYAQMIRCTVGDVDFSSPELQLTPESSSSDANIALLLLHFAAIITSALDNDLDTSRRPFFSFMINPEMAGTSFVLAMPNFDCGQTDQRQDAVPNDTEHYLCSCGTVFVTTRGNICPSCRGKCEPVLEVKKIEVKMSLEGYVQLSCEDTENEEFRVRSLSPAVFRILHLFVHAALYMGPALGIVSEECLKTFLKQTESSQYCYEQVVNDLKVLARILHSREEHVIALLHFMLEKTSHLLTRDTQQGSCTTSEERQTWETKFTKIVNPVLNNLPQVLRRDVMTQMRPSVGLQSSTEASIEERIDEQDASSMAEAQMARLFVPRFFRSIKPGSFEELKMRLVHSEEIERHPFLQLFFEYDNILPTLQHIHSFIKWIQTVNTHLSHRLRRCDSRKLVSSFISGKAEQQLSLPTKGKDSSLQEAFETFEESWEIVRPLVVKAIGREDDYVPRITEMSEMSHCLLESTGDGIFLATALKVLARYQNEFLVKALSLSTNTSCRALTFLSKGTCVSAAPIIHLQDVNEKQIIQFHWPEDAEDILRHSYNNPEYGKGYDVHYDFDKIEMELACLLLIGKVYLSTTGGLREFVFAQELFHSYSNILEDLHQVIPQVPLTQEVREGLQRLEDEDKSIVQDLFSHLESLLCFLKRTNEEADKSLIQYTKEWLSKLPVPFPLELLPEPKADIKLKHVAALYERLEDILARKTIRRLKEIYTKPLPREAKQHLLKVLQWKILNPIQTAELALRRFAYRYLCSGKTPPSPRDPLAQYLSCQSLWPIATFKEEGSVEHMVRSIFPDNIKVEHTVEAAKALQELTKSQNPKRPPRSTVYSGRGPSRATTGRRVPRMSKV